MVRKTNSLRRDYAALLGVVMIVIGTFVIGGFAYAYTHRPCWMRPLICSNAASSGCPLSRFSRLS